MRRISPNLFLQLSRRLRIGALLLCLTGSVLLAKETGEVTGLDSVTIESQLEKQDGDFTDLFLNLKQRADFQRLCRRYRLDDPAVWTKLSDRLVLNLAELQGRLSDAESMINARDKRGGLNNEIISAEKTRAKGRNLKKTLVRQMEDMRQAIRLVDEFRVAFEKMGPEASLTGVIELENKAGQSFNGQVLFVDGEDLIVKRGNAGYFRIPANLLSESCRLKIMNQAFADWEPLPEMSVEEEQSDKNAGELVAYSDDYLYIDDRFEGFISVQREDSEFAFAPYRERVEAIKKVTSGNEKYDRAYYQDLLERLQKAYNLNKARVEEIERYQSRLGLQLPVSERDEAKAYRIEKYGEPEAEASPDEQATVEKTTDKEAVPSGQQ